MSPVSNRSSKFSLIFSCEQILIEQFHNFLVDVLCHEGGFDQRFYACREF